LSGIWPNSKVRRRNKHRRKAIGTRPGSLCAWELTSIKRTQVRK